MRDQKSKRCCSSFWDYMPSERKLGGVGMLTYGILTAAFNFSRGYIHNEVAAYFITMGIFAIVATDEEEVKAQQSELKIKKN